MQTLPQVQMAYDRTIVVFSPDGRLLQVEYAREAIKRGSTCIGIKTKDAVVLGATKTQMSLAVNETHKKIYEIDTHIGAVSSGLLADARDLIEFARIKSQINQITYGEPVTVNTVTKYIADRIHMVTQYAGVRPYGVGLLVGGVDKFGSKLYETDPSGTMVEWKAQALGRGAERARKILKDKYKEGMSIKDGVDIVIKVLKASEKNTKDEDIELAVITRDRFQKLSGKDKY